MNNEQGFEAWFAEHEEDKTSQKDTHREAYDWEGRIKEMCALSFQAGAQFVEAPDKFVDQDKAEKLATELLGKYIAACGCQNKNQIYKASLKLLAVVTQFVEYADEKPAVSLVDVDGKPIR